MVQLRRVGLDRAVGYLVGGTHAWAIAGYPTDRVPQLSPAEVHAMVEGGGAVLVDVRFPDEYEEQHVEGAVNIPALDLRTRHAELPADRPLVVMCRTGQRSSLTCSLLKRAGFTGYRRPDTPDGAARGANPTVSGCAEGLRGGAQRPGRVRISHLRGPRSARSGDPCGRARCSPSRSPSPVTRSGS